MRTAAMLKGFLGSFALAIAIAGNGALAATHENGAGSVIADGGVFYKMPSGELITRDASLEVPARGQGDVILRSGDHALTAHGFKSVHKGDRIVFYVVFLNPPGAPENFAVIYRGSYLRGSNGAKYWGDFYTKQFDKPEDLAGMASASGIDNFLSDLETTGQGGNDHKPWHHGGGFWFAAKVGGVK
ncbi:hypothetical protein EBZ80_09630 [bacterium]|nr:hypothetical protein [bacterium]